jgi:signal transduction histidine kinase
MRALHRRITRGFLYRWVTYNGFEMTPRSDRPAPVEAVVLRLFGMTFLIVFIVTSIATEPTPGLSGRGLVVLLAMIAFVVAAVTTQPQRSDVPVSRRLATLAAVTIATAVLAVAQPDGLWEAGPYFVGIMAAMRLDRRTGAVTLAASLLVIVIVSASMGHKGGAIGVCVAAIPWFLVMRLMRAVRDQRDALAASQQAQAQAAAAAERGRLAREMHDVLAHSLSALALQLESTRLLAHDRDVDPDVARAIDQAHALAATGLQDARRAIATARGDELPGPERLGVLAEAFGEQSGLAVQIATRGQPRQLAPDARLAVYRTAQEALTNVRRHASAQRVEMTLSYLPEGTVLVVEDHALPGTPPPVALGVAGNGYGLTGMRERAELLGGRLIAEPTDDGFRVELRLPT